MNAREPSPVVEPEEPVVRCEECRRVLHDPASRARRIGPVCLLRLPGGWLLSWHRSPPRLGHLPHGEEVIDGQDVLFPVQPMLPMLPIPTQPLTPTSNEES